MATYTPDAVIGFLPNFLRFLILAFELLLLGRVLMSWISPRFDSPLGRLLYEATEPILAPIRRILPPMGMIDFSPIVAFIVLGIVASALGVG